MIKRLPHITLLLVASLFCSEQQIALASVDILYFRASTTTQVIELTWATGFELDNLGFNVLRHLDSDRASAIVLNDNLIAGSNDLNGGEYEYLDDTVQPGVTYYYWLEDIDTSGRRNYEGPIQAMLVSGTPLETTEPPAGGDSDGTPEATLSPTVAFSSTELPTLPATNTPLPSPTSRSQTNPSPTDEPQPLETPTPLPQIVPTRQPTTAPTSPPPDEADPTSIPTLEESVEPSDSDEFFEVPVVEAVQEEGTPEPDAELIQAIGVGLDLASTTSDSLPELADRAPGTAQRPSPQPLAPMVLLFGLAISAAGGAATWFLLRRRQRASS